MPTTVDALKAFLGLAPGRPVDDVAMAAAVDGANAFVFSVRPELGDPADDDTEWTADADQAATLEAARLYGRRGSVSGVAAFPAGGGARLAEVDPDVKSLLGLGEFQSSVVA